VKRRIVLLAAVLALAAGGFWWAGRAPTEHVLRRAAARVLAERARTLEALRAELDVAQAMVLAGDPSRRAIVDGLRARRDAVLRSIVRERLGGWDVLFLPEGAARPAPEDFAVAGTIVRPDGSDALPPEVASPLEVWYAPRSGPARLLQRLGMHAPPRLER
jgi:hypothetical protein